VVVERLHRQKEDNNNCLDVGSNTYIIHSVQTHSRKKHMQELIQCMMMHQNWQI